MTPNTVLATFHWHRPCNTDYKIFSFLSFTVCLAMVSRLHAFFTFSLRNKITYEKRAKQRIPTLLWTPNWQVFSFVVFEKSEILWFWSLMSVVSLSTEVILSNSLGSWPVGKELGQVAKQLVLVRSALDLRFQAGKVRQEVVDVTVGKVVAGRGLEVTLQEQQEQGRVKHEKGEGETKERWRHAHCNLEPCVNVHA